MAQITILNQGNVPMGPFTREQVAQKLLAGEVTLASLAHVEGLSQWTPLRDVLAKVDAVPFAAVPPVAAPVYSYAATMQPPSHLIYAGFWLRFVAVFIDGIIIGIPMGIIEAQHRQIVLAGGLGLWMVLQRRAGILGGAGHGGQALDGR